MSAPEVSVIIPSYNHARFIEAAIGSVLAQTFERLELIVVDDGSSDDSVAKVRRLAAGDGRVRVHEQANAGSHAAINAGISLASAPWLAILNSDDIWEVGRLERMLENAAAHGGDFLFSDMRLIDSEGDAVTDSEHWWNYSVDRLRKRVRSRGVADGLLYGNFTVSTSNFLFRRSVVDRVGMFRRFRYNLDWDFVLRCLDTDGVRVGFVDEQLLRYRLHGKNAILSGMPGAAAEAQLITRQIYRRRLNAPESLLLSHHRHDRLLRRYYHFATRQLQAEKQQLQIVDTQLREQADQLSAEVRRFKGSFDDVVQDRDALARLIGERQRMIEAERTRFAQDIDALERQKNELRDEVAGLESGNRELEVSNRILQAQKDEFDVHISSLGGELARLMENCMSLADQSARAYALGVEGRLQRDRLRCRQALMLEKLDGRVAPAHRAGGWRGFAQRAVRAVRSQRRINESIAFLSSKIQTGVVRSWPRHATPVDDGCPRIVAHLHVYYQDLAAELVTDALRVPGIARIVITGPWSEDVLQPHLVPAREMGVDVQVLVVSNRGKDVGGLLAAVREGGLLDSDLVLKIHSKKSHNPESYFQAISALFGVVIQDGHQWRRALIDPLVGSRAQAAKVLEMFHQDPSIGMVGARPFITSVPDANTSLSSATYARFGVPEGLGFVAGTMFWVRSSLLRPLLEHMSIEEFSLDSREVEGGLEHVMERMLGGLVLAEGFDVFGVDV